MNGESRKTYIFVAGKSGGHIIPGVTLARRLYDQEGAQIIFVTTSYELDQKILCSEQWLVQHMMQLRTYSLRNSLRFILDYIPVQWKMLRLLWATQPAGVYAMGGYPSIPVCIAAFLLRIPYFLYEFNVQPGAAVKLLARMAKRVYVCYKETVDLLPGASCLKVEYPHRFTLQEEREPLSEGTRPFTILLVGGSQGSQALNKLMLQVATSLPQGIRILHQTGVQEVQMIKNYYAQKGISAHVFSFDPNFAPYYKQATVVISRAGAGSLFELLFFKKKSIIIPLITRSTAHQRDNAHAMAKEYPNLFCVLEQTKIEQQPHLLYNKILEMKNAIL